MNRIMLFSRYFSVSCPPMNPTPAKQTTTAGKVQRRVMCQDYGVCLDKAIEEGWSGFTCSGCKVYRPEDRDNVSYWQVQAERSGAILKQIFVDKAPRCGLVTWRRRAPFYGVKLGTGGTLGPEKTS